MTQIITQNNTENSEFSRESKFHQAVYGLIPSKARLTV